MPTDISLQWMPLIPWWLTVTFAILYFGMLYRGSRLILRKQVQPRRVMILAIARFLIGLVFIVMLCRPILDYTIRREQQPELVILVQTSASMKAINHDGLTRLDTVREALEGEFGKTLRDRYRLSVYGFDRGLDPRQKGYPLTFRTTDESADYAVALAHLIALRSANDSTHQHVLMIGDGNDAGANDPLALARAVGMTIDSLASKSHAVANFNPAVVVADFQSARRVLFGSETQFRVLLRAGHLRGIAEPISLTLLEDGKPVSTVPIEIPIGTLERQVTLPHRPTSPGIKRYEIAIDGERPSRALTLRVEDGKNEVLILEDTWRWEFKYLRRIFESDPSFRFTAVLSRGNGAVVQFGAPDRQAKLIGFPQSRADLEEFDTIVLGDVNVRRWSPKLIAALGDAVREGGKSLIVLAGPNVASFAEVPELHTLLPVELARESGTPIDGPIPVRVSADGSDSPFAVRMANGLPDLDQIYAPRKKRPAATVLLEATKLRDSYGNLIVAAEQTVGRGRVLYLGTDTLWKWQTQADLDSSGATPYAKFWQQTLRALTPTRTYFPGIRLWLQPDRTRTTVGNVIRLTAEVDSDRPIVGAEIRGSVRLPDGRTANLQFAADATDPRLLRADFVAPNVGAYGVRANLLSGGKTVAEAETSIEVDSASGAELDVNEAYLARLATGTGGRNIDLQLPETWPDPKGTARTTTLQHRRFDSWSLEGLVVFLCCLLGLDWWLRLRYGCV